MRILALDTATSACSAALWQDGLVLAERFAMMPRGQSEALLPMVRDVLREAGCAFADLDRLAVTVGPGAFTGLRIGLAAARAMSLASGVPCLGVTTLEAVAYAVPPAERRAGGVLVALESKRADLYAQLFAADLAPLTAPRALLPVALAELLAEGPVTVAGDGTVRAVRALAEAGIEGRPSAAPGVPQAAVVAALAATRRPPDGVPPEPLYLRPADVTPPGAARRRRP